MLDRMAKRSVSVSGVVCALAAFCFVAGASAAAQEIALAPEQITFGKQHHFFGYIGQSKTIPWNEGDRYIVSMRASFNDRMPKPGEAADVVLIDTWNGNRVEKVDETRAWNPQQGTMFYWNPLAPRTQFYFNTRDTKTNKVFAAVYDIEKHKRVKEYRFEDTPFGNSGVAPDGHAFLGINYGRMDRLRRVTGYPGAFDWTGAVKAPKDDGIFIVEVATGKKRLLVSFAQMAGAVRPIAPDVDDAGLFINHTLWNRDSDLIYFFCRGGWGDSGDKGKRINVPCTIRPDGTGLAAHATFMGGHPEWAEGPIIIGRRDDRQALYNVLEQRVVGQLGAPGVFPKPEGDISFSPDGKWFVNGYGTKDGDNRYVVYRMADRAHVRSRGFSRGDFTGGDLRIDPAPRWNRASDAILIPSWTEEGTRQLFIIRVRETPNKK